MGGQPVAKLLPGWRATEARPFVGPILQLMLERDSGERAVWLLDDTMERLADAAEVDRWPAWLHESTAGVVVPALRAIAGNVLQGRPVVSGPEIESFIAIEAATRDGLGQRHADQVLAEPRLVVLTPGEGDVELRRTESEGVTLLPRAALETAIMTDLQARFMEALREGDLCWPSPFSGKAVRCDLVLYLDDFSFAYRFCEFDLDLAWFVLATEHNSHCVGLYIPALETVVLRSESHEVYKRNFRRLGRMLCGHLSRFAPDLLRRKPRAAYAVPMRGRPGMHIGHQLWNELSGIGEIVAATPASCLPECWVISGTEGMEVYGPTEELFPELAGRVRRDLPDTNARTTEAYRSGTHLLRVTRTYVSQDLRDRVKRRLRDLPAWQSTAEIAGQRPVIVLGLRVENRTCVNFLQVLVRTIEIVSEIMPDPVVVLDGHNARPGTVGNETIESHNQQAAAESPLAIERRYAWALRSWFAGTSVTILDTLGDTMERSLLWADRAFFFVTIWGAGLAKYRWICNKPGLVLTSQWNLNHWTDLHIYDSPKFMETPTRLVFLPSSAVEDAPEAPMLIAFDEPFYYNFRVDLEQYADFLRSFAKTLLSD